MNRQAAILEELLQVEQHSFANPRNLENSLGLGDEVRNALRKIFDCLSSVAIRTNAERVLPIDLKQVGGFIQQVGDGLVVHGEDQLKQLATEAEGLGEDGISQGRSVCMRLA